MRVATGDRHQFVRFTGPGGLTHQPGLDGLRGLAVAAVVAFHLGFGGASGGFLGVSLFFTLSGFLIGSLILHEVVATGAFSLRCFWRRRARRLLPPALVTLAVIAVGRLLTSTLHATTRADVVAAGLNVANWHFVAADASYADLFGGPSAVLHFWSLAIEEQFYLVVGVLAVALAAFTRRPVRAVFVVACATAAASFVAPLVLDLGVDRTYYGSDTRAGELMVGVAAAAVFVSPRRRVVVVTHTRPVAVAAVVALAVTVVLWSAATPGSQAIGSGLLPLTAGCSLLVIVGAVLPSGPVAALARVALLGRLGRISYALYLVHWPVVIVADRLTDDRSLLHQTLIVAVSLTLAQLSAVFVERPIRRRQVDGRRIAAAAALTGIVVAATSSVAGRTTPSAALLDDLAGRPVAALGPARVEPEVPRVALFGDSVAFSLLLALGTATADPGFERAPSDVNIGCGIAVSPSPPPDKPHQCDDPAGRFATTAAGHDLTAAVMISCQWELVPQQLPGRGELPYMIGDPEFDAHVRRQYLAVADRLVAAGVERVLWTTCPYLSRTVGVAGLSAQFRDSRDPARVDRLNAIIAGVAAEHPAVEVFPFGAWVNARVDDATIRPDGSHFEYRHHNPAADAFIEQVNAALVSGP